MDVPRARGDLSAFLLDHLQRAPHPVPTGPAVCVPDPLADDDLHLALALCYELHGAGVSWADERWEWQPSLIRFRARLEACFEEALLGTVGRRICPDDAGAALRELIAGDGGPGLSAYLAADASPEQFAEFIVHRSHYQLREADPHTWAIPRLRGRGKAALVMLQADEYGGGRSERMHSTLFRNTMQVFELDTAEGAYLDAIPGVTFATVNLMHLFGLHRRWRGAIVGHLAAFEMTSTEPNRRYGDGLRRLGFGSNATEFFDEHVTADAVHELIACDELAVTVARGSPGIASDVLFGAECLLALEARFARHVLGSWRRSASSLRRPLFASIAA